MATCTRFLEKPNADEITCNTINAGIYVLEPETFDRIPKDTAWSIERSFFPSLIERGETFVAYVYDGYWIDIGTPEKYMQVHRDIMDGRYTGAAVRRRRPRRGLGVAGRACRRQASISHGPCFIDEGVVVKTGARILPYSVIGRQCHIDEDAVLDNPIIWPNSCISQEAVVRALDPRPQLPHRPQRGRRERRRPRRQVRRHRLQPALSTTIDTPNPIFKAYDVRGLYPGEVNEDAARAIGRGFVVYLQAKRIACRRDMRLSSPTVAAGVHRWRARSQGADVVDYGMHGDRHAVLRRRQRRPRRRRADHRLAQPEAVQRHARWSARRPCRSAARQGSRKSAT